MDMDSVEDVFLQDNTGPTIAEHTIKCSDSFKKHMVIPTMFAHPMLMDDQYARFKSWALDMDVFGPPNISLDYRLRYSPTAVDILHQLLDVISDYLNCLQPIDDPLPMPSTKKRRISGATNAEITVRADDSSDDDNALDQKAKNVFIINDIIGGTVTRLFRLSNVVRESVKASREKRMDRHKDDERTNKAVAELRIYTESYIRFRFPDSSEALRSVLVEANAQRLRRLCYQSSHQRPIPLSFHSPQSFTTPFQPQVALTSSQDAQLRRSIPSKPKTTDKNCRVPGHPPASIASVTAARQTAVHDLLADSVVGVPPSKSVLVNKRPSFPQIPTTDECPYCGVIVEFENTAKSTTVWNEHVLRDLEPFVCLLPQCIESAGSPAQPLTFETPNTWMNHMQSGHRYIWECRAPSHKPMRYEDEAGFQKHSRDEHDVPEVHLKTLSSAAQRPAIEKILKCPFGDDFPVPENAAESPVFLNRALQQHVASHMKEIALLALQKLTHGDKDEGEYVASNAPWEDMKLPELRRSMYSLLEDESLKFEDAVEDQDSNMVEESITPSVGGLSLEHRDPLGMTRLHHAVRDDEVTVVHSLIQQGAILRSTSNDGKTVFHFALVDRSNGVEKIKLLLNSGAQEVLTMVDQNNQTPLHYAAKQGFTEAAELLLKSELSAETLDNFGFLPFIWAVVVGHKRLTHLFLSHGIHPDFTSTNGKSALGWAASLGHEFLVESLLDMGADIMLASGKPGLIPLEEAAAYGDIRTVRLLLDRGADPNYRDRDGWSAIHWAAEQGHRDVSLLLLERGADIHAVSTSATSVLHCAANGGCTDIVTDLLQRGADPNRLTCNGWTPLHHASFMGHASVVRMLLQSPRITSSHSQDNQGWSALHLAIHRKQLEVVRALIRNSDIQRAYAQRDESGLTAADWLDLKFESQSYKTIRRSAFDKSLCCRAVTKLRLAIRDNNTVLARVFLDGGCDINGMDSGKRTAIYYAATTGNISTLDMLLNAGANPNIIPDGALMWGELISNGRIIERLRLACHEDLTFHRGIDRQIRLALTRRDQNIVLSQQPSRRSLTSTSGGKLIYRLLGRHRPRRDPPPFGWQGNDGTNSDEISSNGKRTR